LVMGNRKSGMATQPRLEKFRALLRDTTDPFAIRLIQGIVVELESRLAKRQLSDRALEQAREHKAGDS